MKGGHILRGTGGVRSSDPSGYPPPIRFFYMELFPPQVRFGSAETLRASPPVIYRAYHNFSRYLYLERGEISKLYRILVLFFFLSSFRSRFLLSKVVVDRCGFRYKFSVGRLKKRPRGDAFAWPLPPGATNSF